jgi:bidirectional [NiFe] hydrogenase diaphorase subunit
MAPEAGKAPPAPKDNRWRLVEATMRRHGHKQHALIEALHTAQEAYGFLEDEVLRQVATELRVPLSKVYGVATFYNFFTLKPQGRHTCVVCTGTACYIKGADQIMKVLDEKFSLTSGATTPDGEVSLLTARCFGSCGLAPAAVFDGEVAGKLSADGVEKRVARWMTHDDH